MNVSDLRITDKKTHGVEMKVAALRENGMHHCEWCDTEADCAATVAASFPGGDEPHVCEGVVLRHCGNREFIRSQEAQVECHRPPVETFESEAYRTFKPGPLSRVLYIGK